MIRRVLSFLATISQALLILTLFFWARSNWVFDWIDGVPGDGTVRWEVLSDQGELYFHEKTFVNVRPGSLIDRPAGLASIEVHAETSRWDDNSWAAYRFAEADPAAERTWTAFAGFQYLRFEARESRSTVYVVPYYLLAALLAILPFWRWRANRRDWRAMKRALARVCSKCGYDPRTATQKCPECGGPVGRVE